MDDGVQSRVRPVFHIHECAECVSPKYEMCAHCAGTNQTRKSGLWYGLRLTLNVHADDYVGMATQSVGARIVVHNLDQFPLPEANGVYAAPGEVTFLRCTGCVFAANKYWHSSYGLCPYGRTLYNTMLRHNARNVHSLRHTRRGNVPGGAKYEHTFVAAAYYRILKKKSLKAPTA